MRAILLLLAAAALGGVAAEAGAADAPCAGGSLAGTFAVVPGSAGAGNIVYALRLRNTSAAACFVSGQVGMQLLDRAGRPLPTHVRPARIGMLTAVIVRLAPGGFASASARFSPDVPGPGEGGRRACEPPANRVRVTVPPGGARLVTHVTPATPVCEHGTLQLSALVAGRTPPGN
jgi:hypothetical protein